MLLATAGASLFSRAAACQSGLALEGDQKALDGSQVRVASSLRDPHRQAANLNWQVYKKPAPGARLVTNGTESKDLIL